MKTVIPGGTGQVGRVLVQALRARGHDVVVLSRSARPGAGIVKWDGRHQGDSWIHDRDFARAVEFLLESEDPAGPVNLSSPGPLPQRDFMAALRAAYGRSVGLPASKWMMEVGAFFHRTDTELILKSRRVVPTRLVEAGFSFEFPQWPAAARDLVARSQARAA